MALRGVRISWLMLARKEDLSVFASSAFTFACTSASSISFRWVTVIEVPIRLSGFPLASRFVQAARTSTHSFCCGKEATVCLPDIPRAFLRFAIGEALEGVLHAFAVFIADFRETGGGGHDNQVAVMRHLLFGDVQVVADVAREEAGPQIPFQGSCQRRQRRGAADNLWLVDFSICCVSTSSVLSTPKTSTQPSFWNVWR